MEKYSEYKECSIPWIKVMPGEWCTKRLGSQFTEVSELNTNYEFKSAFKFNYGTIVRKNETGDLNEFKETYIKYTKLKTNDIVINGLNLNYDFVSQRVAIVPCNGIMTSAYLAIRPRKNVNAEYFNYLFKAMDFMKMFHGMGTGIRLTLSFSELKKQLLPIPPLSEQTAIVTYLDDATAKMDKFVTKKEQEIELLEKLKQRMIADAVTKGLASNAEMVPCDIPWIKRIPKGWSCKRIGTQFTEVNELNTDYEFKTAFKFNYGTIASKNETGDLAEYMETYVKYLKLKTNDIVINGLNLNYDFISQRVAIVPSDGIMTSAYLALRPRMNVNAWYFNYLFKAMDFMKLFHGMGTGIRLTLSFSELKKQNLPIPPIEEQQAIVDYIKDKSDKIDKLKSGLQQEIEKVKLYKQRLISDVVTGQIKVC